MAVSVGETVLMIASDTAERLLLLSVKSMIQFIGYERRLLALNDKDGRERLEEAEEAEEVR